MIVWWLPQQRALWRPTTDADVNRRFLSQAGDYALIIKPGDLSDDVQQQLLTTSAPYLA
jgi:hypothetical protein